MSGIPSRIHEVFEQQVARSPDRTAVVVGHERIDYGELNRRANRIAHALVHRGVGRGDLVGVCLERGPMLVPALLGVLKSGAAFVGLDPSYPDRRLRFVARDANLAVTLVSPATAGWRGEVLAAAGSVPMLVGAPDGGGTDEANPDLPGEPGDAAYVIYTSGSTGRPKGVVVEHASLCNLAAGTADLLGDAERAGMLAAASICFDASVLELLPLLAHGGTVVLADNLLALHTLPARDEVTTVFGVPSALVELLRQPLPPGVRTVVTGGEAATAALVERAHANPGVTRVLNLYGPTEATIYCTAQEVAAGHRGEVPIGRPVAGAVLSVRDPDGAEVPDGHDGELWVAGPVLARGYLDRPELTADRYVHDAGGVRHYRTGDLVRRVDGVYHYRGRLDDQVKVRGFRIELGEVQAALAEHPRVANAVVVADGDLGARRLVGYVEPAAAAPAEHELRSWLAARLPGHMVPARVAVLDRLPVAPNGKVDRAALPAVGAGTGGTGGAGGAAALAAPATPTEELVASVVAEVLGVARVRRNDRFVDLGGHSLAAARVCAEVAARLGVTVPLAGFLADPTVAGLAALVTGAAPEPAPVPRPGQERHPLTATQRELWTLAELDPGGTATTVAVRFRVHGLAGAEPLRRALRAVVERHRVLRTTVVHGEGGPVAVVRPAAPVPVVEHDARALSDEDRDGLARAAAGYAFDLATQVPLLRAHLLWTADGVADAVVVADHTAFDGASVGPLMTELAAELAGEQPPGPRLQVADLALYEQDLAAHGARRRRAAEFWRAELADVTPPDDLPGRRRAGQPDRPDQPDQPDQPAHRGDRVRRRLDPDLVERLRRFAAARGTTPFAGYLAALSVVLTGQTGRTDTLVGVAVARRDLPGTAEVIGPLVTVLPVGVDTADDPSFAALAERGSAATVRALTHVDIPPAEVLPGELTRAAGAMFTPVMLSVQPSDVPLAVQRGGIRVEYLGDVHAGGAQRDLAVFVTETVDGVEVQVQYDVSRFDRVDVSRFTDRLVAVLAAGLSQPDGPVSALPLVSERERADLLGAGTGPRLPADRPRTVVAAVLAQAARRPDAPAVSDRDGVLSYAELAEYSGRVAAALAASGAGPGTSVGVCVPRDRLMPAVLLGVLRSGAAYVPLDPEHPPRRLSWLAADAGLRLAVSRGSALPPARAVGALAVLDLDELPPADAPAPDPAGPAGPADLAYVLYTSGSTGTPKGVEVTHANLAAHTEAIRTRPGLDGTDRMLVLSPLTFDANGIEIWSPLAAGAGTVVVERDCVLDGHALAARVAAVAPTVAFLPPTLLRMLLAAGWAGDRRLRVWAGGEAVDSALAREALPRVGELWNVYGPTETTTVSTVHRVSDPDGVPIGTPLAGEHVYVVDPLGRLVPPGVTGELWIGGAGVARGYRGRPDLTDAAFVPDPYLPGGRCYRTGDLVRWTDDLLLDFVGRRDHQVKLRGQRMELGEIEAALRDHPDVSHAVVAVHGAGSRAVLVGYVTPSGVDTDGLERHLRARLPEYMVPRRWVPLDALPLLPGGKVDRGRLPEPVVGPRPDDPPRTTVERFVARVWAEVVEVGGIRRDDDFFSLGGNSFAATRVVGRLRVALDCEIPVRVLFEQPVLADFAAQVERLALERLAHKATGAGLA